MTASERWQLIVRTADGEPVELGRLATERTTLLIFLRHLA